MKKKSIWLLTGLVLVSILAIGCPAPAPAEQEWELVNPAGAVEIEMMEVNPHPASLEGKTVGLRWNGKHNGNHFLDRVAELLTEQVKGVKVIKLWEAVPGSESYPLKPEHFEAIAALNPDLVIGSQAD